MEIQGCADYVAVINIIFVSYSTLLNYYFLYYYLSLQNLNQ